MLYDWSWGLEFSEKELKSGWRDLIVITYLDLSKCLKSL